MKHGWLSGFSLAQVTVPVTVTVLRQPGPCGPVAAGCYGASAAELELEGVLLVLSGGRPLTGTVTAARRPGPRPAECHSLAA